MVSGGRYSFWPAWMRLESIWIIMNELEYRLCKGACADYGCTPKLSETGEVQWPEGCTKECRAEIMRSISKKWVSSTKKVRERQRAESEKVAVAMDIWRV